MSGLLLSEPRWRELSDLGLILNGAKLHTYVAGTPSTPLATYSDVGLSIPNANPIVASSPGGLFGPIYAPLGTAYKLVLTDSLDNPVWSQDNVSLPAAPLTTPVSVANGGTGLTFGTSGGVPYFSAAATMASSAQLAQFAVVVGGGAGAAPATIAAGATGSVLSGVTGANPAFRALGIQDQQVTLQTVSNTVVETSVYSYAVPANTLGTTRRLVLELIGDHLNNSGGTDSVRVRVKYGATTIFDGTVAAVNNGANRGALKLRVVLQAAGATNAQRAAGDFWIGDSTQNNAGGVAASLSTVNTYMVYAVHNAVAEDSTGSKNLVVTFQMGTAAGTIDMRAHTVTTELA